MKTLSSHKISLYGGGKMGGAMLSGWLRNGVLAENLLVIDPKPSWELQSLGVKIVNPNDEGDFAADIAIMAVKPQIFDEVLSQSKIPASALLLSIAAGVTLQRMAKFRPPQSRIIRAMPNTPSAIGAGITAFIPNGQCTNVDCALAESLLSAVGSVVQLESEDEMDAVTAVSGSGPAYVFHMIEAMQNAGEKAGLSKTLAARLALETVAGAGQLALQSDETPAQLRENVTSPGGTTAAGLEILMNSDNNLLELLEKTVNTAKNRSTELGQ